ncbi:MAG TPA: hypothetical protein VHN15_01755 [Thermoanaerobaculia bacterium]|nr:hypothetical protein [Thermoanaerobaculia bacterium]
MLNDRFDVASAGNLVRVSIPAKVAFDLKSIQRVTAQVLGQLGCENCHSGYDIRFDVVRDFIVDEKLGVRAVGL